MDETDWVIEHCEFLQDIGLRLERREEGFVRLSLPFDERLTTPGVGALHGGIVATLIDNAGGVALRSTLEAPSEVSHATTDLNVSYLRPAIGDLRAEARVLRAGSSTAVVRVDVTSTDRDGSRQRVAVGRVTLHVDRPGR